MTCRGARTRLRPATATSRVSLSRWRQRERLASNNFSLLRRAQCGGRADSPGASGRQVGGGRRRREEGGGNRGKRRRVERREASTPMSVLAGVPPGMVDTSYSPAIVECVHR